MRDHTTQEVIDLYSGKEKVYCGECKYIGNDLMQPMCQAPAALVEITPGDWYSRPEKRSLTRCADKNRANLCRDFAVNSGMGMR